MAYITSHLSQHQAYNSFWHPQNNFTFSRYLFNDQFFDGFCFAPEKENAEEGLVPKPYLVGTWYTWYDIFLKKYKNLKSFNKLIIEGDSAEANLWLVVNSVDFVAFLIATKRRRVSTASSKNQGHWIQVTYW